MSGGTPDRPVFEPVALEPGGATTRVLRIANGGQEALTFELRIATGAGPAAAGGGEVVRVEGQTPNETDPTADPSLVPYAEYSGSHLYFGISTFGEILPYQYPIGNEHLRVGTYLAGYTLAYRVGSTERLAYAAFHARSSLTSVSYEQLENSASRVRVGKSSVSSPRSAGRCSMRAELVA